MLNRKTLTNGNTQVEDFAACRRMPIGEAVELPMNAFGSVMKRFTVIAATVFGDMVAYELAAA